jgi:hypothetical protein
VISPIQRDVPNQKDSSNAPKTSLGYFTLDISQVLFGFRIPSHDCIRLDFSDYNIGLQKINTLKGKIRLSLNNGQIRGLELASQAICRYDITTFKFNEKDGILQRYIPDFPKISGLSLGSSFNVASFSRFSSSCNSTSTVSLSDSVILPLVPKYRSEYYH